MSLGAIGIFTAMIVITTLLLPAELGRRADPNRTPLPILSDWYFLALYQYVNTHRRCGQASGRGS